MENRVGGEEYDSDKAAYTVAMAEEQMWIRWLCILYEAC